MLQIKNLTIYLESDGRKLIDAFDFSLNAGDKVAVIGEEGNGKSTLLQYLACGKTNYVRATGDVVRKGNFGYLPQFFPTQSCGMTVAEYFADCDLYANVSAVNSLGLDFSFLDSDQRIATLSGGEKIKIQLLKILCGQPDALFLDEPTGDLDLETLAFLESFLIGCRMPVMFISHDETLLADTANAVVHVEQIYGKRQSRVTVFRGGYEDYLRSRNLAFERQAQTAERERAEDRKRREKLAKQYEKAKNNMSWKNPDGIPSSDGRAKRAMESIKAKERRFDREESMPLPVREESIVARFGDVYIPSQKVIVDYSAEELRAGDRILARNLRLTVAGSRRVCIVGRNGAGKSTLLARLWEQIANRTDVAACYMPQNYAEALDFSLTPDAFLRAEYGKEERTRALTMLGNLNFTAEEMRRPIGELSGGQQAKLLFSDMVLKKANVLLLDEPTRNFSPLSAPVVRKALREFRGTIIAVSHDRKFLEEVAEEIYWLDENGLTQV